MVVVTKTFPASDVRLLAELGVRDIGENRDQEAAAKAAECRDLDLTWHFVGQLQTNKARSVARYADVVHSLDRPGSWRRSVAPPSTRAARCRLSSRSASIDPRDAGGADAGRRTRAFRPCRRRRQACAWPA